MTDRGMMPAEEWAKTKVHSASQYGCSKCGEQFGSPEAVYAHLDKKHPTKAMRKRAASKAKP